MANATNNILAEQIESQGATNSSQIMRDSSPNYVDGGSQFDRAPDGTVLVARAKSLATIEAFNAAFKPILERNSMEESAVRFEGLPAASRIQVRALGAKGFASRKVAQMLGSLREPGGPWLRHHVVGALGARVEMFIDADKSPCQIKTEQLVKTVCNACAEACPRKWFFGNELKGAISIGWKPIISILPQPGDIPPEVKWARKNLVDEGADKGAILQSIASV
ncbi:unnamed protein product, partial [Prorocentrum cordatum]